MSEYDPQIAVFIQNDSGEDIPPRSVVVITSVEITPQTDEQESIAIHHVTKFTGQGGNVLITGNKTIVASPTGDSTSVSSSNWWSGNKSYGLAYADMRVAVQINPSIEPPIGGEQWGPVSGQWFITRGGTGFFADGYATGQDSSSSTDSTSVNRKQSVFMRGNRGASSTADDGTDGQGCGCCDGFNCLSLIQATVGGCAAAPDGAAYQYIIDIGLWAAYPNMTESGLITLTYGMANDCPTSSSSWASGIAPPSNTGCLWASCLIRVCEEESNSGSGSSTEGIDCAVYQFYGEIYTNSAGKPAFHAVPVLRSGYDVLGIAETL